MAVKKIYIGSMGPFEYDDAATQADGSATQQAFRTEGSIEADSVIASGLTTNVRLTYSDANKALQEVNDLTAYIAADSGISVADDADGTVTISIAIGIDSIDNTDSPYSAVVDELILLLLCNANAGAITVNLPAASGATGFSIAIKKTDSSTNEITIDGNTTETIDGEETKTIKFQNTTMHIVSDGTNWYII